MYLRALCSSKSTAVAEYVKQFNVMYYYTRNHLYKLYITYAYMCASVYVRVYKCVCVCVVYTDLHNTREML